MDKKKSKVIQKLKEFKHQNNIEKMYWFGSRVTGIPNRWSDIDLIIVSKQFKGKGISNRWSDIDLIIVSKQFKGKGLLQRAPPLHLKWNLNYPVDLLCYTPEEFNKLKKQITLVRYAVKEGIEI